MSTFPFIYKILKSRLTRKMKKIITNDFNFIHKIFKSLPPFFKRKKVWIPFVAVSLLLLFTPISLHQINKKIAKVINTKARNTVQTFEKEVGLNIEWEHLTFKILTMSIEIKNVKFRKANTSIAKKNKLLKFLTKEQEVEKINIRPNLKSIFFEKNIFFSKVQITNGNLYLQTIDQKIKPTKTKEQFHFPIKNFIIKGGNVFVKHKDQEIQFLDIDFKISKKSIDTYRFNTSIKKTKIDNEEAFSFDSKGGITKNRIYTNFIKIKNETSLALFDILDIRFNSKGVQQTIVKSSGQLPSRLINKILILLERDPIPDIQASVSYGLNLKWNNNKYKGDFNLKGGEFYFKKNLYDSFSLKGQFLNKTAFIDQGFVNLKKDSSIGIKKIEILFAKQPYAYNFSLNLNQVPLSMIIDDIIELDEILLEASLVGEIQCRGDFSYKHINCEVQNQSEELNIENVISFYDIPTQTSLEWKNNNLTLNLQAKKQNSSQFQVTALYKLSTQETTVQFDGQSQFPNDVRFPDFKNLSAAFKLDKGILKINQGALSIKGEVSSSFLEVEDYILPSVVGSFVYNDNKLYVKNIQGSPGQTNYKASLLVDFKKTEMDLDMDFSFLRAEDIKQMLSKQFIFPLSIDGTGQASFSFYDNWSKANKRSLKIKGDLFNATVDKEPFKNIGFDISLSDNIGQVHNLLLKKSLGLIRLQGFFNQKLNLDLRVTGERLPLENIHFLNEAIPFHQSGLLNFSLTLKGPIADPEFLGNFKVTQALLYSFPVDDIYSQIKINKKGLLLTAGNIMNEFFLQKFYYPFYQKDSIEIKGSLAEMDFIKILLAQNQKEKIEDEFSRLTGEIDLKIDRSKFRSWTGYLKVKNLYISKHAEWIKNAQNFSILFSPSRWSLTPMSFYQSNNKKISIKKLKNKKLHIKGESFLSFFNILFPIFNKMNGEAKVDVIVDQNIKQLHPQGTIQISKGLLSIPYFSDVTNIESSIEINNTKINFKNAKGFMREGSVNLSGNLFYNFQDPLQSDINVQWSRVSLQIPKNFISKGDGWLNIEGLKPPYLLKGQYFVDSGNISQEFSQTSNQLSAGLSTFENKKNLQDFPFVLDLNVTVRKPISINNSILKGSLIGETQLSGPLFSPLLKGEFRFPNPKDANHLITFRDQEFKISSGSVKFQNANADNPFIDVKAETVFLEEITDTFESQQEKTTEFRIFLNVDGFVKNLKFNLESLPARDEKEIISMLTLGMSSKYFDANVKTQNVTGYYYHLLGSVLLQKSLNKEFSNALGLNLNISPHINVINEPVTKITLHKTWFDRVKTSFSRTLEEFPASDMKLKYDLQSNLSLTAFWENTEHKTVDTNEKQKMGLDFEFNFDF